jgi:hypothetical protein
MPNHLTKLTVFCVLLSASTAASANSFLRIGITPATGFAPGTKLKVIGQAVNLPPNSTHGPELRLQVGRTDGSWNFIAPKFTSTVDVPFGSPNAAHWSGATFPPFPAPPNSPTHRFKMAATILIWTTAGAPGPGTYLPLPGIGNHTVAMFQYKCIPVNNHPLCSWKRQ